jgi:hypothetical protein
LTGNPTIEACLLATRPERRGRRAGSGRADRVDRQDERRGLRAMRPSDEASAQVLAERIELTGRTSVEACARCGRATSLRRLVS